MSAGDGLGALVPTVRGPVPANQLGLTLAHEHVFVLTPDSQANWPGEWDEEREVDGAVAALSALVSRGVRTIVDPTVDGLGRDVARVARVNARVPGLNIVVATGLYTYSDVPGYFRLRGPGALPGLPDPLVDLFVSDLTIGIAGTAVPGVAGARIRAGFLKCAVGEHGMTAGVRRVMLAVAAAHRHTGAPVMVHTDPGSRTGLAVRDLMADEGVPAASVQLAHCGDSTDVEHLVELAEAGFTLGMDRFGLDPLCSFDDRVATVAELCRRGYATAMVLSHDAACYLDWLDPALRPALPNWHFGHLQADVLPALARAGVTQAQVHQMLVENPARWLASG